MPGKLVELAVSEIATFLVVAVAVAKVIFAETAPPM